MIRPAQAYPQPGFLDRLSTGQAILGAMLVNLLVWAMAILGAALLCEL